MRIKKYYKMVRVDYSDSEYFRLTNVDTVTGSISFANMSGKNIEYSTDGVNWTTLSIPSNTAVTIDNVAPGTNVYLRGTNSALSSSSSDTKHITADFNHNIGGNIVSLLDKTNYATVTSITNQYAFNCLFYNDTKLISAGEVNFGNVTRLGSYVLAYLFKGCTALTTPPDLTSVQTLDQSALAVSFSGCTALTSAPNLSNVTSLGYFAINGTFSGCTSLTTAPDLSNVTNVAGRAFDAAFNNCSRLQTIYVPNIDTWDTSIFGSWVNNAGSLAATPKQMIFQTQALLDLCPSGTNGYGVYTKVLA